MPSRYRILAAANAAMGGALEALKWCCDGAMVAKMVRGATRRATIARAVIVRRRAERADDVRQVGDETEQHALESAARRLRVTANEQGRSLESASVMRQLGVPREELHAYVDGANESDGRMKRHVAGAGGVEEHAQLAGDHQIDSCLFYVPVQGPPPPSMRTLPGLGNAAKPACVPPRALRSTRRLSVAENADHFAELTSRWGVEIRDIPATQASASRSIVDAGRRGVFANRAFSEGELVWSEEPLLSLSLRDDVCALCAAPLAPRGGGVSSRCGAEQYCGEACRADAWSLYFRAESEAGASARLAQIRAAARAQVSLSLSPSPPASACAAKQHVCRSPKSST